MNKMVKKNNWKTIPEGYKQTEVGVIPDEWSISSLGELAEKIMVGIASAATHAYCTTGIPMLRNQNIKPNKLDSDDLLFINKQYELTFKNKRLKKGDLLTARTGYPGTTCIIPDEFENAQSFTTLITRPTDKINSLFLSIFMNSEIGISFFEKNQIGEGQKNINAATLKTFIVATPSLQEQAAIANVLSDTDALIIEFEKLIAKKQAIKTGTMQQLLTGRTRLPKFAKHPDGTLKSYKSSELGLVPVDWEVKSFSEITKLSSSRINPKVKGGGDLCIELEHIQPNSGFLLGETITTSDSSLKNTFEPGDILFGKLRAYLKKYWFANINGVCSTEFWVFKPNIQSAISKFIYYIVQTDSFIALATEAYGSHMPRADWKVVKDYQIMLPGIEEQTAIANILSDMDAELTALEQKLSKIHDIKQGMMQQLLTGRIRLPLAHQP